LRSALPNASSFAAEATVRADELEGAAPSRRFGCSQVTASLPFVWRFGAVVWQGDVTCLRSTRMEQEAWTMAEFVGECFAHEDEDKS
jgi:hypothetical protein